MVLNIHTWVREMERNGIYIRQESMNLDIPNEIHILGVGGVGTWVAYNAALMGVPLIHLYDGDTLADHNRNRLPYPDCYVDMDKVSLCADALINFRTVDVVKHGMVESANEVESMSGIIVNCMDYPMKLDVQQFAAKFPIWTLGANSTRYSITNEVPKTSTWNIDEITTYTGICAPTVMIVAARTMGLITAADKKPMSISSDIRSEQ